MHVIRPGIRGFAGASLIALAAATLVAAAPACAASDPATDAPALAGAPAPGPIVSGRV